MKLLKVKTDSGFKMLEPGFEINFLTKTKVNDGSSDDELLELEEGFYYPLETIFIGKNSSGKSTTLQFLFAVGSLFDQGRIHSVILGGQNELSFEALFYDKGSIYCYNGTFVRDLRPNHDFFLIKRESLKKASYKKSLRKDLSNASFEEVFDETYEDNDTSHIKLHNISCHYIEPEFLHLEAVFQDIDSFNRLFDGKDVFGLILHLFDDSIEYIRPANDSNGGARNALRFKRVNSPELLVSPDYLMNNISDGTLRGIKLFCSSCLAFLAGGHVVIDEIEKNFNKNLIENLLMLFRDKKINKEKASIIFSTHYSELLDETNRCDNINVLHRNGDKISLKNLSSDYEMRTDISKTSYYDQNAFDNNLNYDRLMDLRKAISK